MSSNPIHVNGPTGVTCTAQGWAATSWTAPSPYTYSLSATTYDSTIKLNGSKPTIETEKSSIDIDELAEILNIVKQRLLILTPAFEKHEQYPALKQAWEHYKIVEKLILSDEK
jgi:hypothetical protein